MGKGKRTVSHNKAGFGGIGIKTGMIIAAEDIALSAFVAWCFYDSPYGLLLAPVIAVLNGYRYKKVSEKKKREAILLEFKEMLLAVSASLQSGSSVENAFKDAEESMRLLYRDKGVLLPDISKINSKVGMRQPIEKAFFEFADERPEDEIVCFATVFGFGKRLGGDYIKNLRRTVEKIEDGIELKQEIAAATAEKRMELSVMSVMPAAIIAYIKLASPEFISALYHTMLGVGLMSVCIVVYVVSVAIGMKITDIRA